MLANILILSTMIVLGFSFGMYVVIVIIKNNALSNDLTFSTPTIMVVCKCLDTVMCLWILTGVLGIFYFITDHYNW